jgi:DNA-binding XRE family transcriptional regulator
MKEKQYPPINEKIKAHRQELGLKDTDVAQQAGMTIDSYWDIEHHTDEIFTVPSLAEVRMLCTILGLNCLELFALPCAYCEGGRIGANDQLPRNELIRKRREELGLTTDELADQIGYYGMSIEAIESGDLAHLDSWVIDEVLHLATVLNLPPQLLLGFKCPKCRH